MTEYKEKMFEAHEIFYIVDTWFSVWITFYFWSFMALFIINCGQHFFIIVIEFFEIDMF